MEDHAKPLLELAEAFIKNEVALETYYRLCADRIPEFKDRWLLLSEQERGHVAVYRKITESIKTDPSKWVMGKYNAVVVNMMSEETIELIGEIRKGGVAKRHMVTFAANMELSMIERDIGNSFTTPLPELQALLSKVAEETAAHREILIGIEAELKD